MLSKTDLRSYIAEFCATGAQKELTRFTLSVYATSYEEALEIVRWSYHEIVDMHCANLDCSGIRFQYNILPSDESEIGHSFLVA